MIQQLPTILLAMTIIFFHLKFSNCSADAFAVFRATVCTKRGMTLQARNHTPTNLLVSLQTPQCMTYLENNRPSKQQIHTLSVFAVKARARYIVVLSSLQWRIIFHGSSSLYLELKKHYLIHSLMIAVLQICLKISNLTPQPKENARYSKVAPRIQNLTQRKFHHNSRSLIKNNISPYVSQQLIFFLIPEPLSKCTGSLLPHLVLGYRLWDIKSCKLR